MADSTRDTSSDPQKNIEFLHGMIQKKEHGEDYYSDQFIRITDEIQDALGRQASDDALNALAHGAIRLSVSDVHLEVHEKFSTILFRIDGELAQVTQLDHKQHAQIAQRLKYRSNLKLNITNVPQDGKFRLGTDGRDSMIDVRVSTLPTRYGESVVCRVLDSQDTILSFNGLGISGYNKKRVQDAMKKKQGMILVTGPTGSGKTTSLYTLINELNTTRNKIITLEDPIEYQIQGVLQSEINERDGYSFASGVRSILRHDPDIIMIGEIRDLETANTAIQASLTGHLVLSTLHTKSSFETIERLINMGVERYDLAAALDVIVAQRLVRKVCTSCHKQGSRDQLMAHPAVQETIMRVGKESVEAMLEDTPLYTRGDGCGACGNTGYHGRTGIFEVCALTEKLRDLIRTGSSGAQIREQALKEGFYTFKDDGIIKVLQGVTDLEELYRVIDV